MTAYTKSTNFATKDTLTSGDPLKIVKGTEINTEFDNIATAVNSKANTASPTFTGTVTIPSLSLSGLTASSAVATDGSSALVSVTNTGSGNNVLATSPTLVTPALGTPASGVLTNCTGVQYNGFKNRIINGAMVIDQRNAGASVSFPTTAAYYTVDRWYGYNSVASKFTVQQNAGSLSAANRPTGFTNYLGVTSTSAYSVLAADAFIIVQAIEGLNVADLNWGTANAATVTLSFWVRSSLTGTFGGSIQNSGSTRSYPFSYSIPVANTWTAISITIAGDTSGTWLTTNGTGISIVFGMGVGSTGSGTAGAWAGANYVSATGATSVVGTNGATFYITGVQLEKGSTATSFDYRPYGTELSLCQRYYGKTFDAALGTAPSDTGAIFTASNTNATTSYDQQTNFRFSIPMRTAPTVAGVNPTQTWGNTNWRTSSDAADNTITIANINTQGCSIKVSSVLATQWSRGHLTFTAEL